MLQKIMTSLIVAGIVRSHVSKNFLQHHHAIVHKATTTNRMVVTAFSSQSTTALGVVRRRPNSLITSSSFVTSSRMLGEQKVRVRVLAPRSFSSTTFATTTTRLSVSTDHTTETTSTCRSSSSTTFSNYGEGMDQNAMMEQDCIVAVDENDNVIPNDELSHLLSSNEISFLSKKRAHQFTSTQPRGIAHRAFSVFLFNSDNKMLLTKRSKDKITFPNVWTNTCCSHPIYGQTPNEVDDGIKDYPYFPGIKYGAIRKLQHELGIKPEDVPHDQFHFISRFHYWAADTITYSKEEPKWGEHEVDYVLFIKRPVKEIPLNINPEEVDEYKYVSIDELKSMFDESSTTGLLWSPWFRGIMERGGFEWWEHLDEITSSKEDTCRFTSPNVEFFDPPNEHYATFNHNQNHTRQTGVLHHPPTTKKEQ